MQAYVSTSFLLSLSEIVTGSNNYILIMYLMFGGRSANIPFLRKLQQSPIDEKQ